MPAQCVLHLAAILLFLQNHFFTFSPSFDSRSFKVKRVVLLLWNKVRHLEGNVDLGVYQASCLAVVECLEGYEVNGLFLRQCL